MKIAIVGGDLRNLFLADELNQTGLECDKYAVDHQRITKLALSDYEVIIGPIPFSQDGKHLYTPLYEGKILITDFLSSIEENATLMAGAIGGKVDIECAYIDLTKDARLYETIVKATNEGIIQAILDSINFTISGASVLVLGYGKIGKSLSMLLRALGAGVNAYSIDEKEIAEIRERYALADISDFSGYEIIINTIPAVIIDHANIGTIKKGTTLIDVASAPGGIDIECAKKNKLPYLCAPGIPGKKAPLTVARTMKEIIIEYMAARHIKE